jgi:hypothetical protein
MKREEKKMGAIKSRRKIKRKEKRGLKRCKGEGIMKRKLRMVQ